jgi:transcriptional regulator with XRE-family HTH domain
VSTQNFDFPQKNWLKVVGANIRRERVAIGLTQERLAELSELAPRTIQKIEAGRITILITTLRRIQRAVGCPYAALLREDCQGLRDRRDNRMRESGVGGARSAGAETSNSEKGPDSK